MLYHAGKGCCPGAGSGVPQPLPNVASTDNASCTLLSKQCTAGVAGVTLADSGPSATQRVSARVFAHNIKYTGDPAKGRNQLLFDSQQCSAYTHQRISTDRSVMHATYSIDRSMMGATHSIDHSSHQSCFWPLIVRSMVCMIVPCRWHSHTHSVTSTPWSADQQHRSWQLCQPQQLRRSSSPRLGAAGWWRPCEPGAP